MDKINQGNFDKLLNWLGATVEESADQYEYIRRVLIKIFLARGLTNAEDLADETIDRVASRLTEIENTFTGEKIKYFLGVARFVAQESLRKKEIQIVNLNFVDAKAKNDIPAAVEQEFSTIQKKCLQECFSKIKERHKTLILNYYNKSHQEELSLYKSLAKEKNVTVPALRNQVYRVKMRLFECARKCSEKK